MVKLYRAPQLSAKADIRLLDPRQERAQKETGVLFKKLPDDFRVDSYSLTSQLPEADFVIVPQSIRAIDVQTDAYLDAVCAEANTAGKRVLAFITGDYANRVHIERPELIVFKSFEYRKQRRTNEVMFAPFVEDLGEQGISLRAKAEKPTVSFCGYAGFKSLKARVKYEFLNAFYDLVGKSEYKRGIYFRKRAMDVLTEDARIHTDFIVRNFFSGNLTTAASSPETLRREYIDNIRNSDFVLCPKGDGNYSSRFYETLSLGRFPVLIDTDMVLPFEKRIDYSRFVVRVPFQDVRNTADYITRFYGALSDAEFKSRQQEARDTFRNYLRFDAFFNRALPLLKEQGISGLA